MNVEPAAGSSRGPDCQRPAVQRSRTVEMSVAISTLTSSPSQRNCSHRHGRDSLLNIHLL